MVIGTKFYFLRTGFRKLVKTGTNDLSQGVVAANIIFQRYQINLPQPSLFELPLSLGYVLSYSHRTEEL